MRPGTYFGFAAGLWLLTASVSPVLGGWWDDLDKGERVRLSDVVADPGRAQGKTITFPCVFRGIDEVYFPYFTSFSREKHLNLSVWLDGAPIWERESYAKDEFPFLYVKRDHPQRDEVLRLAPFTRVEVTGTVKDVFRGKPWIEVAAFRVAPATLGREVVEWVKSGDAHAARGDYARAETFYARAIAEVTLEETYALRIRQRRGQVLRAAGKDEEAGKAEGGPIVGGTPIPAAEPAPSPFAGPREEPTPRQGSGQVPPRQDAPAPPPPSGDTFPTDPLPGRAPPAAPAPSDAAPPAKPSALTSDLPGVPYRSGPKPAPPPTPAPPAARPPAVPPKDTQPPPAAVPPAPTPAVPPRTAQPAPSGRAAAPGQALPPPPPPGPCEPLAPAAPPKAPPTAKPPVPAPTPPAAAKPAEKDKEEDKDKDKDAVVPPAPPPRVPRLSGVR